jgi:hypothetical protein
VPAKEETAMTEKSFGDDPLIYSETAKRQIAEDPELADVMKDVAAKMRQALHAWQSGQYPNFETAMAALGCDIAEVSPGDEDYEAVFEGIAIENIRKGNAK